MQSAALPRPPSLPVPSLPSSSSPSSPSSSCPPSPASPSRRFLTTGPQRRVACWEAWRSLLALQRSGESVLFKAVPTAKAAPKGPPSAARLRPLFLPLFLADADRGIRANAHRLLAELAACHLHRQLMTQTSCAKATAAVAAAVARAAAAAAVAAGSGNAESAELVRCCLGVRSGRGFPLPTHALPSAQPTAVWSSESRLAARDPTGALTQQLLLSLLDSALKHAQPQSPLQTSLGSSAHSDSSPSARAGGSWTAPELPARLALAWRYVVLAALDQARPPLAANAVARRVGHAASEGSNRALSRVLGAVAKAADGTRRPLWQQAQLEALTLRCCLGTLRQLVPSAAAATATTRGEGSGEGRGLGEGRKGGESG